MPVSFILAIIAASIGAVAMLLAAVGYEQPTKDVHVRGTGELRKEPTGTSKRAVLVGLFLLFGGVTGILVFSASATKIPTRVVGVEVSLGQALDHPLENGFHMVTPWHTVERFNTAAQFPSREGDDAVTVRLGNQTTAKVDIRRNQWNIDPKGDVVGLYRQYKTFDKISDTVVVGAAQSALTEAFQTFDPLAGITKPAQGDTSSRGPTVDEVSAQALKAMREALGTGITVTNLQIFVHYDDTTQTKLNDYAVALAGTRIATQNTATAGQIALANKALAEQSSVTNPGVQYQNCLNLIKDLAARNQLGQLPQTFNCGDPRSSVIVNGK